MGTSSYTIDSNQWEQAEQTQWEHGPFSLAPANQTERQLIIVDNVAPEYEQFNQEKCG